MAASTVTQDGFNINYLLKALGINIYAPIISFGDIKACISFSIQPDNHRNFKHIDYRNQIVKNGVQHSDIKFVDAEAGRRYRISQRSSFCSGIY